MVDIGDVERVLSFWFGKLDSRGRADAAHAGRWWNKDPAFDEEIRRQFGDLHARLAGGAGADWLATARGRLAYVIVLDQFSRNLFRGQGRAFATDGRALAAAEQGVQAGSDRTLAFDERGFFYMPYMHAEKLEQQDRGVQLFASWRDELTGEDREKVAGLLKYAEQHRDIIKRFGRFCHRNQVLGRASTPEEVEFLKQPGSSF